MGSEKIISAIQESKRGLEKLLNDEILIKNIEKASILIYETIQKGSNIYTCGNGGSMCDAMHFAEELSGRFRENRKGLTSIAISDPSHITCVGNDFGFEFIFSRFLEANAHENDLLLAISTSGKSKNILMACEYCKKNNIKIITLTGAKNSIVSSLADLDICTPNGNFSDRVQELHTLIIHIIIELVEDLNLNYKF